MLKTWFHKLQVNYWERKKSTIHIHTTGNVHDYTWQTWGHAVEDFKILKRHTGECWAWVFSNQWLQRGDIILLHMQSGKVARFAISSVDQQNDPKDMYQVWFTFVGYKGE
jgi:hypothetical protein